MKATIDGKTYDTQTAELVASDRPEPGEVTGNFLARLDSQDLVRAALLAWVQELHITPEGNWFLYHQGKDVPFKEPIEPLAKEQAREWLETNTCIEELEVFAAALDDGEKV